MPKPSMPLLFRLSVGSCHGGGDLTSDHIAIYIPHLVYLYSDGSHTVFSAAYQLTLVLAAAIVLKRILRALLLPLVGVCVCACFPECGSCRLTTASIS